MSLIGSGIKILSIIMFIRFLLFLIGRRILSGIEFLGKIKLLLILYI